MITKHGTVVFEGGKISSVLNFECNGNLDTMMSQIQREYVFLPGIVDDLTRLGEYAAAGTQAGIKATARANELERKVALLEEDLRIRTERVKCLEARLRFVDRLLEDRKVLFDNIQGLAKQVCSADTLFKELDEWLTERKRDHLFPTSTKRVFEVVQNKLRSLTAKP